MPVPLTTALVAGAIALALASAPLWVVAVLVGLAILNELYLVFAGPST